MTVYVDFAKNRYGRLVMAHMIADTHEELIQMSHNLGLKDEWLQYPGTWKEHFDVAQSKRLQAIILGAKPITSRELVQIQIAKREER